MPCGDFTLSGRICGLFSLAIRQPFALGFILVHHMCKSSHPNPTQPSHLTPAPQIARHWCIRWALRILAVIALGMGIAGVFIPGLPTTVFILIAGWAAMRSSPRLHQWLHAHRLFGPMLRNWEAGGCVSRRAKVSAGTMMLCCALVLWLTPTPTWVQITASTCMALVWAWLWMRPEPPAVSTSP